MKQKLVTLDMPAYSFFTEFSKETSGIQIKYDNNPFYVFCKNFELITAQVYRFLKLKNDKQNSKQSNKQHSKQSLEDFCTLVAVNLLNSCSSNNAEEDFDTIVNFLKKEFSFPDSLITNSKKEIKDELEFMKYYYDDVLGGLLRDQIEAALAKKAAKVLAKILTLLNHVEFSKLLLKSSALFGKCSDDTLSTIGVFIIATISMLETADYCDVFTLYEYLLNNRNIFEEIENEIAGICKEFIGKTVNYKQEDIPALAQENLLCIDSIIVGLKDENTGEISSKLKEEMHLIDKADRAPELSAFTLANLGKSKYVTECNKRKVDKKLKDDVIKDFFTYLKTSLFINYENWGIALYTMINKEQLRKRLTYEMTVNSVLGNCYSKDTYDDDSTLAKIYTLIEYERVIVNYLLDTSINFRNSQVILPATVDSLNRAAEAYLKQQQEIDYENYRKNVYNNNTYLTPEYCEEGCGED